MALKSIPSVVQLPGGRKLNAVPFKITGYDDAGHPTTFELLPAGSTGDWYFFAEEDQLRNAKKK